MPRTRVIISHTRVDVSRNRFYVFFVLFVYFAVSLTLVKQGGDKGRQRSARRLVAS